MKKLIFLFVTSIAFIACNSLSPFKVVSNQSEISKLLKNLCISRGTIDSVIDSKTGKKVLNRASYKINGISIEYNSYEREYVEFGYFYTSNDTMVRVKLFFADDDGFEYAVNSSAYRAVDVEGYASIERDLTEQEINTIIDRIVKSKKSLINSLDLIKDFDVLHCVEMKDSAWAVRNEFNHQWNQLYSDLKKVNYGTQEYSSIDRKMDSINVLYKKAQANYEKMPY